MQYDRGFSTTFLISRHLSVSLTSLFCVYSPSQNSGGAEEENRPVAAAPDIPTLRGVLRHTHTFICSSTTVSTNLACHTKRFLNKMYIQRFCHISVLQDS